MHRPVRGYKKVRDHCLRVYLSSIYFQIKQFWDTNNVLSYVQPVKNRTHLLGPVSNFL